MATLAKMVTKTLDVGVSNTTIDLSATIKSFDILDTKFIFGITSNQGLAINLSGATVKYIVEYYVEGKTYAIEGNCLVVDINTISFNLPDQLRGYNGKALIGIYATLTDGTKIDIKNIVVNIEPSLMDKGTDFKARYYFESFDNVLASVKDAGNKAISQINTVLPAVQSKVAEIDRQIKSLPSIPDLFVAYANSADGSVDFSRAKPKENLWEQSKTVDGWFENDGTLTNAYSATQHKIYQEYISVNPNDIYYLTFINPNSVVNKNNSNKIIFLDENKRFIDKIWLILTEKIVRQIKIPVPSNARYMRVGVIQGVDSYDSSIKIKLEKSDTPTTYLPSKYDNYRDSFMKYIGYSVKNSTNPSDYRWQVNPEWQRAQLDYEKASTIQDKLVILITNADFSQGLNGWTKSTGVDALILNGNVVTVNKLSGVTSISGIYTMGTGFLVTGRKYYVSGEFRSQEGYTSVRLLNNTVDKPISLDSTVFNKLSTIQSIDTDKAIRFYAEKNSTFDMTKPILYDLTAIFGAGNEPNLEEFERLLAINVNSPTIYNQSILKAELNSNPINSILTTLSAENPSTTLGGTWTQLGTESKFGSTIYYWKRTN